MARIETSKSRLELISDLPSASAQAIVTGPTRAELEEAPAELFGELHRALRDDGTLWLLFSDRHLPAALIDGGWMPRPIDWGTPLRVDPAGRARLRLFVKQERFHYSTRTAELFLAQRTRAAFAVAFGRRRSCVWSPEHRDELMRLCVLASTSRIACGVCATAYVRTRRGESLPACTHDDPNGSCLVLDPFYHPGAHIRGIATRRGRTFLGISGEPR
jgi:hypothetical protein